MKISISLYVDLVAGGSDPPATFILILVLRSCHGHPAVKSP